MNTKEDDVRERIQQLQKMKKLTENRLSGGDPPTCLKNDKKGPPVFRQPFFDYKPFR